jgi:hypothetical protein
MLSIGQFVVNALSEATIKAFVMWVNCLMLVCISIGCGMSAPTYPDCQAMFYTWSTLTGIGSVCCGIAFFVIVMS